MKKHLILLSCIICVFLCSTISYAALLTFSVMPELVPEPASMLLLGFGLIGFTTYSRKKLKKQ
ncbi:MAG: PEP-CTERM sorting domain-containing protein [Desulfobacteraceae bacterium]|nr:PEP-CTERM sorting domain-containing protein [Desulfobacteraceae bacterium]MBC2719365.1 PEP-CTERM sorting domain-containing protein [Desulfobacteraceae bacterium]